VQKAVYHYEGSVNKFLMDDKGSTLIACFGLSPVSHSDDALRAVLSALYICERLFDLSFPASVSCLLLVACCCFFLLLNYIYVCMCMQSVNVHSLNA
jgi:hypothetical protein